MSTRDVRERTLAALLLALVGTLGLLGGIAVDRLFLMPDRPGVSGARVPAGSRSLPAARGAGLDGIPTLPGADVLRRLANELELSDAQRQELRALFEERRGELHALTDSLRPRFREIVRETREGVEEILTPEQRRELRRLLRKRSRLGRPPTRR